MSTAEIQQKVIEFLISTTGQSLIVGDTELEASGLIDSLRMMDLLVFFESEFGVRLDVSDLTPATFHSPATISQVINSRLADTRK